ncbi:phosphatidylserine decarboxylase [Aspergillus saccharolyticus JOP 1030-1]|uniref:Phosphatidylserine decarboxylase n=1 Tax=Aspergillus saccharolyticus JOP 1030-1 TaxID=1450539 RepID=A0A318ZJY6_9EURO|nr:phosphatidylserine decarboxylase [Aspergillus saccharolyticus JOP 1030-1]PYH44090.1 phosphatidylserine decarboxylase [Aspergillus saccharolyticus JOP 1030-1]
MDFLKSHVNLPNVTLPDLRQFSSSTVKDFATLIKGDPQLFQLASAMFIQTGSNPMDIPQRLVTFLTDLDQVVRTAPSYNASAANHSLGGTLGLLTNVTEPFIKSPAGRVFFSDARVDKASRSLMKEWTVFLTSPESASVLHEGPGGWFSSEALGEESLDDFDATFVTDPAQEHHRYVSWDDFFIRRFREGVRPIADPDNDTVITAPCEAIPFRIQTDLQSNDIFDIKEQKYSLRMMFDDDQLAEQFIGGRLYQGYLHPTSYHRWHAPISGTILAMKTIQGRFAPALLSISDAIESEGARKVSEWGKAEAQAAVHEASRSVIVINNERLGAVGCVFAGIRERGSCEPTVKEGDQVGKGDEIGMFHFGGSSHALIFSPSLNVFFPSFEERSSRDLVNSLIGRSGRFE